MGCRWFITPRKRGLSFTNALRNKNMGTHIRVLALRPDSVRTNLHFQRVGQDEEAFNGVFEGASELGPEGYCRGCTLTAQSGAANLR